MRRWSLSVAVLALGLASVGVVSQPSAAAPLPATYSASAGGDLAALYLDDFTTGPNLSNARLAATDATMSGGTTPNSAATASNLGAALTSLGIAVQSNTQTAPPDHTAPTAGPLVGASSAGLFDLAPLNSSIQARTEAAVACAPGGGMIANAQVSTGGAILSPTGIATVVATGNSTTAGEVSIVPEPTGDPFNRAVLSKAVGTITNNLFLNGSVRVAIAGESTLRASATGEPGGADVSYTPGTVTANADTLGPSAATTLHPGESVSYTTAVGQAVITMNEPTVTESSNGRTATGSVTVVRVDLIVGSGTSPLAMARVDLLPLRASAVAPDGGIDCAPPPPVLNTPTNGSTITDTTPTFTGVGAVPGADVDILVDGNPIGTTMANSAGNFSFTPGTAISSGDHQASARAVVNGATSAPSNVNDFTILTPPVLVDPADGSATSDTTPTFAGTTLPGAQVDILVDGNPLGTTTANSVGGFSFTPAVHRFRPGTHQAWAKASGERGSLGSVERQRLHYRHRGPGRTDPGQAVRRVGHQ